MKNVYFDVCGIAIAGMWEDKAELLVTRIRQIGTNRLVYGSDAATADNKAEGRAETMAQSAIDPEGVHGAIDSNVAPYVRNWVSEKGSRSAKSSLDQDLAPKPFRKPVFTNPGMVDVGRVVGTLMKCLVPVASGSPATRK